MTCKEQQEEQQHQQQCLEQPQHLQDKHLIYQIQQRRKDQLKEQQQQKQHLSHLKQLRLWGCGGGRRRSLCNFIFSILSFCCYFTKENGSHNSVFAFQQVYTSSSLSSAVSLSASSLSAVSLSASSSLSSAAAATFVPLSSRSRRKGLRCQQQQLQQQQHLQRKTALAAETIHLQQQQQQQLSQISENDSAQDQLLMMELKEVDVLYNRTFPLIYDPQLERYIEQKRPPVPKAKQNNANADGWAVVFFTKFIAPRLSVAFLPAGVTPNYYTFMQWRVFQRLVNANLNVFGTQSLLMGLGIKTSAGQLGAWSAALKWVLKDALGKMVRMIWASKMGQRFDSDAKRWRFRSSFVFAAGNALEITTYIFPRYFLVWATLANCCKQVSMLTSSSTRTAIYNSFRDGTRENIGDITAKGEAQIAIVDLIGIGSGVTLSRFVGTSPRSVLITYFCLQAMEIVCMYRQLRCVQYRVLNFERMVQVISKFCEATATAAATSAADTNYRISNTTIFTNGSGRDETSAAVVADYNSGNKTDITSVVVAALLIPTPFQIASKERIFLPPRHLSRRSMAFGSLGRAKLSPAELLELTTIVFAKERFFLVVGENVKNPRHRRHQQDHKSHDHERIQENCHIVLHEDATNVDIVKSTLALTLLRRKLAAMSDTINTAPETVNSSNCMHLIQQSIQECDQLFTGFLKQLSKHGWESPGRFMFGRVHMRAYWPLAVNKKKTSAQ